LPRTRHESVALGNALQLAKLYAECGSPKYEKARGARALSH